MEKAFWGIMGALTITFLGLLGVYLYKSGAFSRPEEVIEEIAEEKKEDDLSAFLQPTQEKYGDAMKALEDDRDPIRQQESPDLNTQKSDIDINSIYSNPSGEIADNRNDGYDNFLEEKETSDDKTDTDEKEDEKEDDKGTNVKTDIWEYTKFKDHIKITKYLGNDVNLTVPEKFDNIKVTEIGDSVFAKNIKLVNVKLPDAVGELGTGVFKECTSLVDVTLPQSLKKTGKETFMGCNNLVRMTLPNSLKTISESTFEGCSYLSKVTAANDIVSIEKNAFKDCIALQEFDLGKSLTFLGESAFSGCVLISEITIPKTLDVIGPSSFDGCQGLVEVTFPKKSVLTVIGDTAFQNCILIEEIALPSSLTSIGEKSFIGCAKLSEVSIPKSVISIKGEAFGGCAIKEITVNKSCVINETAFPSGIEKYYY